MGTWLIFHGQKESDGDCKWLRLNGLSQLKKIFQEIAPSIQMTGARGQGSDCNEVIH
jgi:hypothetical protein